MASDIKVYGVDELNEKFGRLKAQETQREPLRASLLLVADRMSLYQNRRPKAGVKLSYKLRRGWRRAKPVIRSGLRGLSGRITNPEYYAPWIQGEGRQFDSTKADWLTEVEIVVKSKPEIEKLYQRAIDEALED